jgi:hypothetical protein
VKEGGERRGEERGGEATKQRYGHVPKYGHVSGCYLVLDHDITRAMLCDVFDLDMSLSYCGCVERRGDRREWTLTREYER